MGTMLTHAEVFCYFWTCGHDEDSGGISHRLIWDATDGRQTGSLDLQQGGHNEDGGWGLTASSGLPSLVVEWGFDVLAFRCWCLYEEP